LAKRSASHYKVLEKLGEGGMGEVYRARDTKLNRDAALKILPQVFAQDQERMVRFEREAQVLASLKSFPHCPDTWNRRNCRNQGTGAGTGRG
jgi:serine/threonine-protein kinase